MSTVTINMSKQQYRRARRLIRDNGRAAYEWLDQVGGDALRALADAKDWLAERADIVSYCQREGIACTVRHTRKV